MAIHPPRPRGPHLNAMRCFEAAARLGGFSTAADELSVTPGAVSQQIKSLEDWIGAPLFERRSQGVTLTALGAQVTAEFTDAFDALGGALHTLRINAPDAPINIAALPAIAQLWLSPRLASVRRAFPTQSISITAMETAPNLAREVFDLSLFIGEATGDLEEIVVMEDAIFPVCSPDLAANISKPSELLNLPIILDATWADDWPLWQSKTGQSVVATPTGARFSLYSIALEEARSGAGVMMGHACLVAHDIESGRLVAPLKQQVPTGKSLLLRSPAPLTANTRLAGVVKALLGDDV